MKPFAVLIDRDGTLARIDRTLVDCEHPDWGAFNAAIPFDTPVPAVVNLTRAISPDITVVVLTGRSDEFRWPMTNWLNKHGVRYDKLLMRGWKDQRSDDKVKEEIFRNHIEPFYQVLFAVDDRPIVCDMWDRVGVPLVRVSQPEHILPAFAGLGLTKGVA